MTMSKTMRWYRNTRAGLQDLALCEFAFNVCVIDNMPDIFVIEVVKARWPDKIEHWLTDNWGNAAADLDCLQTTEAKWAYFLTDNSGTDFVVKGEDSLLHFRMVWGF